MHYVNSLAALVVRAIESRRNVPAAAPSPARLAAASQAAELSAADIAQLRAESKAALVMRLLQGESLAAVSRSCGVPAVQLEVWRSEFLAGAMERLGEV
jgi:DNA-directed RNA polymerase specialized sigma24 family protein